MAGTAVDGSHATQNIGEIDCSKNSIHSTDVSTGLEDKRRGPKNAHKSCDLNESGTSAELPASNMSLFHKPIFIPLVVLGLVLECLHGLIFSLSVLQQVLKQMNDSLLPLLVSDILHF
jgi:hypothetical protein